jgi:hypothetical protein
MDKDLRDRKKIVAAIKRLAATQDGKFVLKYLNNSYVNTSSKRENIYDTYYALGQADLVKMFNKYLKVDGDI